MIAKTIIVFFLLVQCSAVWAAAPAWYQCNGCGRNSVQNSRGCDLEYDLAPVKGARPRSTAVAPGERIDIDVEALLDGVASDFFVTDNGHSFRWRETGVLYHTLGGY